MGRLACWVIVTGSAPTAFRAQEREELLPTLKQLLRTQPDAVVKWFSRGQLWDSPLEAITALKARRQARNNRDKGWRPGGTHVDPRAKYQLTRDEKRARFRKRQFRKETPAGTARSVKRPNSRPTKPRGNR
jgi:hypothetical protein